ncbi:MAG: hypothetical protein NW218_10665, partial [Saprospiraceae bacterium]|nr:hypothetical protein [Saprospiraceae bacterium]
SHKKDLDYDHNRRNKVTEKDHSSMLKRNTYCLSAPEIEGYKRRFPNRKTKELSLYKETSV